MSYSLYKFEIYTHNGAEEDNFIDNVNMIEILTNCCCMHNLETKLKMLGDNLVEDTYLVIEYDDKTGEPVKSVGVYFNYNGEPFMDCAEHDFRVIASIGLGVDLV